MKDPEKVAELRAHLQRLEQQLAADAAVQRRTQLVSSIKVQSDARLAGRSSRHSAQSGVVCSRRMCGGTIVNSQYHGLLKV